MTTTSIDKHNDWDKYSEKSHNDSVSVYNEKELHYLDKYLPMVQNAFDVRYYT
jgi:hypothetical protein